MLFRRKKKNLQGIYRKGDSSAVKKKTIWPLHPNRRVIRYQNYPFQSPHLPKTSFFFSYTLTARKGQWRIFRKRAISRQKTFIMLTLPLATFFMKLVWRMYNTGTVYMSTHSNMLLRQVLKVSMELKSRYKVALWENSFTLVSKLFYGTEPWNHQQMCAPTKIFGLFERKRQNFRKIMNFWSDLYFWYHITGTMLKRFEFNQHISVGRGSYGYNHHGKSHFPP